MSSAPPNGRRVRNGTHNYQFYDENFRPMWNRGISRKIGESAFVQQKLPTIRPSWSAYKVCPFLLLMGALFVGIGVGIKMFSDRVQEITIPYTHCQSIEHPGRTCLDVINKNGTFLNYEALYHDANDIENCTCHVPLELTESLNGTVYMFYALTDYYQNHKDYYLSRDESQLAGKLFDKQGKPKNPSSACDPFDRDKVTNRIIYPCGLMANSMFTDEITLHYNIDGNSPGNVLVTKRNVKPNGSVYSQNATFIPQKISLSVPLKRTGIAWNSEIDEKYENNDLFYEPDHPIWENFTKPYRWKKTLWQLDPDNSSNNGVQNEDFIVWMRTAAFPWFRKLYRIVDSNFSPFEKGLPKGNYTFKIKYNYDVRWEKTEGEKKIILSTSNMEGAKNMFLAIVYMGTGSLCMFLSIVLFIVHKCAQQFVMQSIKED